MKNRILHIAYIALLLIFTAYVLLDTFVIPRSYVVIGAESGSSSSDQTSETVSAVSGRIQNRSEDQTTSSYISEDAIIITENTYSDESVKITITTYYEYDTYIYVADVVVTDPDRISTALAANTYGRNITATTSGIASENNAVFAVNGDFYGSRQTGYVIRNGVLYRSTGTEGQEDLVIYADGSFEVIDEGDITAEELLSNGAVQVLSFGPSLISDGLITVSSEDEVDQAMTSNPRTAIGIIDDLHYIFVVSDGRTDESEGLSLYELAEFMEQLGAVTAYNLDGGGSSTMYFNGSVVNNPTTNGSIKERSVSDIILIS